MLFLDGAYIGEAGTPPRFRWVKAPTNEELTQLAHKVAWRIGCSLEREGLLARDAENSYLESDTVNEYPMDQRRGTPSPAASPWCPAQVARCYLANLAH